MRIYPKYQLYFICLQKGLQEIKTEIINAHNTYRKLHDSPEVTESATLAWDAQRWADILAARGYAQYSDTPGIYIKIEHF